MAAIRQWARAGERAPHKPLLLLYALGQVHRTGRSSTTFADAEPDLGRLLDEFGPPRPSSPAYPFRRLANDEGLWTVTTPSGEDPGDAAGRLRELEATGQLAPDFEEALRQDAGLVVAVARYLLEDNWPETMHTDIAAQVGLDLEAAEADLVRERAAAEPRRRRDPGFRDRVLLAYEYRCAFCGYDGQLDRAAVGLDAAHLRWWAADGPDEIDNALCLCTLHHRLLDRGVLGLSPEHDIRVSKHFIARSPSARSLVLDLAGAPVAEPQPGEPTPEVDYLAWHDREVFRAPERQPRAD